ncbi:MAG: hypothetical protein WC779_00725 [Candidatus Omnitrophota bacterium]|jgi:hypothetical protein
MKIRIFVIIAAALFLSSLSLGASSAETASEVKGENDYLQSVPAIGIDGIVSSQNTALEMIDLKNAANTIIETQNAQNLQINASSGVIMINEALYFDQLTIIGENIILVLGENGSITIGDSLYINTNSGTIPPNGASEISTGSSVTVNGGVGTFEIIENIAIPLTIPMATLPSAGIVNSNNSPGATFVMTSTATVIEDDSADKLKQRAEENIRLDFIRKRHAEMRSRMLESFESSQEDTEN